MSLKFDPISSPDAKRDVFVDLSAALETDEKLVLATVVSTHPTVLAVSNVAINEDSVSTGGLTTAAGQGVHLTVATLLNSQAIVPIEVFFEGDSGTNGKYQIIQPIVNVLCS
ncbi:MAG: hypothetical protein AAGD11_02985 [Planctomycetota bacterium]